MLINKERLVQTFLDLLAQESPSFKELPMAKWLTEHLKKRGFAVVMDDSGEKIGGNCGNIIAFKAGNKMKEPICFAAHMDQIPPCHNIKPIIEGDLIRTDGTTTLGGDDKAGIATILEAVETALEEAADLGDLYLLFTVCEEQGLLGAKNLNPDLLPVKNIIIIDATGPSGIIAYKAPALNRIEIAFKGKKAHAGIEPEKGINGINLAADAITKMHNGRVDRETTVNIGKITGGWATNVVPDQVTILAEIRSHSMETLEKETAHMISCCEEACRTHGASYESKIELDFPAFELSKQDPLFKTCIRAFEKVGVTPNPIEIGGGSDGNVLSGYGYHCAIISVGMDQVHTVEETLRISEMAKTSSALKLILADDLK